LGRMPPCRFGYEMKGRQDGHLSKKEAELVRIDQSFRRISSNLAAVPNRTVTGPQRTRHSVTKPWALLSTGTKTRGVNPFFGPWRRCTTLLSTHLLYRRGSIQNTIMREPAVRSSPPNQWYPVRLVLNAGPAEIPRPMVHRTIVRNKSVLTPLFADVLPCFDDCRLYRNDSPTPRHQSPAIRYPAITCSQTYPVPGMERPGPRHTHGA